MASAGRPAEPAAVELWRRCRRDLNDMRLREARVWCEKALEVDPSFNGARNTLGWTLLEQGRTEEARDLAGHVVRRCLAPTVCREARVLLAAALTVLGHLDEAVDALKGAIRLGDQDEAVRRYEVLCGGKVTLAWVRKLLPKFVCWSRKGEDEAARFLARRGIVDPELFHRSVASLSETERARLAERGRRHCPW